MCLWTILAGSFMREITQQWYEARQNHGTGTLGRTWDDVADVKDAIDRINGKRKKETSFIITAVRQEVRLTDSGKFEGRSLTEFAIEEYPDEKEEDC